MTMGCDMSGIAVGALAVCAAAIPDDIKLQPKRNDTEWQEAARLWVALVGPVSTMKTPMLNAVAKPLRASTTKWRANNQTRDGRVQQAAEGGTEKKRPTEAAPGHDHGHHDRGGAGNPEGQPGRRASGSGRTVRLVRLDGQVLRREGRRRRTARSGCRLQRRLVHRRPRHSAGRCSSSNLSVSILGGIQPEPIRKLAEAATTTGFCSGSFRSCCARPWAAGTRRRPEAVFDYNDLISNLRELKPPMTGGHDCLPSSNLKFDDGA